jgi:peptidoglycan hydrolase CwlO-like protein
LTTQQDIESVAAQLADLTKSVTEMASQLNALRTGAEKQQERADTQQERIDLAARELAQVSERLQAAANALRQSI